MSKLKYFDGTTWKVVNGEVTGDTLPIGGIIPYGSATAPTNWLVCDGSAVSRTDYSELFAVIGTSYGAGDGSTTFNLPDLRGRVAVGRKSTDTSFDTMGETGGEKSVTLTSQEIPTMSALAPTSTSGGSIAYFSNSAIGGFNGSGAGAAIATINGGGQAHNNLQPYQVVCYIIKAKQSSGVVANVSNTQSDSTTDTYSCDYTNKALGWKLVQSSVARNTDVSLSNITFNELWCVVRNTSDTGTALSISIPYADLTTSSKSYRTGFYYNSGYNAGIKFDASKTKIRFEDFYVNGATVTTGSMNVYYR